MSWKNVKLIFMREIRDQLRDRRTLFMITILPVLLYPMLGFGIVEMMLTFSEQHRNVVILNADELPATPAFLSNEGIKPDWFDAGKEDTDRLNIVTDFSMSDETEKEIQATAIRGRKSVKQLLKNGQELQTLYQQISRANQEDSAEAALKYDASRVHFSNAFAESGVQVLVLVPDGYADAIQSLQNGSLNAESTAVVPALKVLRNSADDKSNVAFGRIRAALSRWEGALRQDTFEKANLAAELQSPASLQWIEVARGEEVSANVWSKIFPAMIVIMALTGAFYPAIDLGAGEKERGTMETVLISPARRIELVFGKFLTILLFSIGTALMNLFSMGFTGQHMASTMGAAMSSSAGLQFPAWESLVWLLVLLVPLAALFSALCLALATFAKSTKEGQYYLTPLLMAIMGLTMFCLSPAVEINPFYSVIPVVNIALLLKGLLLSAHGAGDLLMYTIPVLGSSLLYSALSLWWAVDLYNSEGVLFRESEKFDLRSWLKNITRTKEPVPQFAEAIFCFIVILLLQFTAMNYMKPDLTGSDMQVGQTMMKTVVVQQLTMIACPALIMGLILTTSLRATFRLRKPSMGALAIGAGLALLAHPLSIEISAFLVDSGFLPPPPMEGLSRISNIMKSADFSPWLTLSVFALTPSICEEIAFRGFILSGLARGGRLGIAVVISSLMFGIIHMIPQQAFNAAMLGLLLGLLAVYSRSLLPAIVFHLCNNTIATLYGKNGFGIQPNGVFFSHKDEMLRYEWPTLILCGIGIALLVNRMLRELLRQKEEKRLATLKSFESPVSENAVGVNESSAEVSKLRPTAS